MLINTRYDIGDRIEFVREQETVGGKKIDHDPEVGIIEKILFNGEHIFYLMKSSYQSWIREEEIKFRLREAKK